MAVITISRQFGSGARALGQMIADRLGYIFADSEVIEKIAEKANVTAAWVESIERGAGTRFTTVITRAFPRKLADLFKSGSPSGMDEKLYLDYLVVIIAQLAEEGNVVIMGRGSQYILGDHPDAYHILLVDDYQNRIKSIEKNYNLSYNQAIEYVISDDKRRKGLYRLLGKTNYDRPDLYHLILNMGLMDLQTAANLVMGLIKP